MEYNHIINIHFCPYLTNFLNQVIDDFSSEPWIAILKQQCIWYI